jgi:ketosteroid isomerase-like protein
MSEKSTDADHAGLIRGYIELMDRTWDLDALEDTGIFAPDCVWDMSHLGLGTFEGMAAARGFLESWWANWEDHHHEIEELVDLGQGVVFAVIREDGRPVGSSGRVQARADWVYEWAQGKVVRMATYTDVDEGRAAAERLADERE